MKVNGQEVSPAIEASCMERMRQAPFKSASIVAAIDRAHKDFLESYRTADRILQRERRAGNIEFDGKTWRWIGPAGASQ